jgi:hypothetical protein
MTRLLELFGNSGAKKGFKYRILEWLTILILIYTAYYEAVDKLSAAKVSRDKQVEEVLKTQGGLRDRVFRLESVLMHQPVGTCPKQ